MSKEGRVEFECSIVAETEKAILVKVGAEKPREVWIPLSAVHEIHREPGLSKDAVLVVDGWIARERGIE